MRQATTGEKIDPLMRIQEEIKEVVRREQEYRQLVLETSPTTLTEYDGNNDCDTIAHSNSCDNVNSPNVLHSIIPMGQTKIKNTANPLIVQDDNLSNTPSLSLSVNSKESFDGHHSDDSGISASSNHVNKHSTEGQNEDSRIFSTTREQKYIGPNCYNITPDPPRQKLMTRTVSTPHLAVSKSRQFTFNPAHKGVMQRFIATRGKIQLNNNNNGANNTTLSNSSVSDLTNLNTSATPVASNAPFIASAGATLMSDFEFHNPASIVISTATMMPSVIERDADGRPIRPGYIPVEVKIQRELLDLKNRESELKRIRKTRQSTPDLLDAQEKDNENTETDEDDAEVEHCYGPGKLRSAKSINELCSSAQYQSISPGISTSPDFDNSKMGFGHQSGDMRPAMSLAQLCDLDPKEAPSSHRLIAQWESLIQQNA